MVVGSGSGGLSEMQEDLNEGSAAYGKNTQHNDTTTQLYYNPLHQI